MRSHILTSVVQEWKGKALRDDDDDDDTNDAGSSTTGAQLEAPDGADQDAHDGGREDKAVEFDGEYTYETKEEEDDVSAGQQDEFDPIGAVLAQLDL